MYIHLIWACDPNRQFEAAWIYHLLSPYIKYESFWFDDIDICTPNLQSAFPVVVESGLLLLEQAPSQERISKLFHERQRRFQFLINHGAFGIIHLSDEEGKDGSNWYRLIPNSIPIWRNFHHSYLSQFHPQHLYTFPIGPRKLFLDLISHRDVSVSSCQRFFPWAFMGTLWSSGSRLLAVSLFLNSLPHGVYFGGKSFSQGLPLADYRLNLLNSIFSLCPEGDRHLDTFRLWESLCCRSIPLLVSHNNSVSSLLPDHHPIPVFKSWQDALLFSITNLSRPKYLAALQSAVNSWWFHYQSSLRKHLIASFKNSII